MLIDLTGKCILVTGASSGIGRAAAQIFDSLGASLVLVARNRERLEAVCEGLPGRGHCVYPADLTQIDAIPGLVKTIAAEAGPLSGVFHAAGIFAVEPLGIVKEQRIDSALDISVKAAIMLARGFCQKSVRAEGVCSLVFMSSAAGARGQTGMSVYSASKAAVEGAVRSLACELAQRQIRVNAIAAGAVRTPMHDAILANLDTAGAADYERKHLLGFGEPEDVARAAAFLLSDAAKWITGTTMVVDGGYCCH